MDGQASRQSPLVRPGSQQRGRDAVSWSGEDLEQARQQQLSTDRQQGFVTQPRSTGSDVAEVEGEAAGCLLTGNEALRGSS